MKLTPSEARVYEYIKQGIHPFEIEDMKINTVKNSLKVLKQAGYITVEGKNGENKNYRASHLPYEVKIRQGETPDLTLSKDRLVKQAASVKLDEDRLYYLKHHRQQNRTKLRKKLGLSRFELTILLENLA